MSNIKLDNLINKLSDIAHDFDDKIYDINVTGLTMNSITWENGDLDYEYDVDDSEIRTVDDIPTYEFLIIDKSDFNELVVALKEVSDEFNDPYQDISAEVYKLSQRVSVLRQLLEDRRNDQTNPR